MTVAMATPRPSASQSSAFDNTNGSGEFMSKDCLWFAGKGAFGSMTMVTPRALGRYPSSGESWHCPAFDHGTEAAAVNLNTITEVRRPSSTDEIPEWREGYAWLAGGTWLFSTPQISTHTLIDLESLRWPALKLTPDGLEIAA